MEKPLPDFKTSLKLLFESANEVIDSNISYGPDAVPSEQQLTILKQFIDYIQKKLNLKKVPKVYLTAKREGQMTTGAYDPANDTFKVRFVGRSLVDVLRTIAHELVHHMQKETGKFKPDEKVQDAGGPIEDEANAKAGEYIKTFVADTGLDSIYDL